MNDAVREVLFANFAGTSCELGGIPLLEPIDWGRLLFTCKKWKEACEQQTSYEAVCQDRTILLFRWGMATSDKPRLYITFPPATADSNVSRSFGWKGRSTGVTHWYKIRFDPITMLVHTGDYTFAKLGGNLRRRSQFFQRDIGINAVVPDLGELAPLQTVNVGEYTPYATCYDCSGLYSQRSVSSVDLRGTPFAVESRFKHGGYCSAGSWTFAENDQCVGLTGGGYCGWTISRDHPFTDDDHPGAWSLRLKLLDN